MGKKLLELKDYILKENRKEESKMKVIDGGFTAAKGFAASGVFAEIKKGKKDSSK